MNNNLSYLEMCTKELIDRLYVTLIPIFDNYIENLTAIAKDEKNIDTSKIEDEWTKEIRVESIESATGALTPETAIKLILKEIDWHYMFEKMSARYGEKLDFNNYILGCHEAYKDEEKSNE